MISTENKNPKHISLKRACFKVVYDHTSIGAYKWMHFPKLFSRLRKCLFELCCLVRAKKETL